MKKLSFIALFTGLSIFFFSCKEKVKEAPVTKTETTKEVVQKEKVVQSNDFNKNLTLGKYSFKVHATNSGSLNKLHIQSSGFEGNQNETIEIDGSVTGAEMEDLNGDGFPEILVYTQSAGSGSYGNVICYSSNNGKSFSQVTFMSPADSPKLSKGYMGHDEFSIVEGNLSHRFPTYKEGDTNASPTGKTKQVQYKLVNGENSRVFVIKNISEY